MTIREELKEKGFTDKEINKYMYEAYERQIIEAKKAREDLLNKLEMTSIDKEIDKLMNKLAWKKIMKEKSDIPEFIGDINNPIDIYNYKVKCGILPILTIHNADGSCTHLYEDGFRVTIKSRITLSEIKLPSSEDLKIEDRRLLAELLGIDEEESINMSDNQINRLVLKKQKYLKKITKKDK